MKIKNIIVIIVVAVAVLIIGGAIRQNNLSTQSLKKQDNHDIWYCPMHPNYISDRPGTCPICGMNLVKRTQADQQQKSAVEGYTTITVSAQKQQLAGVKTVVVSKKNSVKTIRAAGQYEGKVIAQVFEVDLEFIKVGQKAIVEIPAYHQKYEGAVLSIDSSVDEVSRTIPVRIWLKHPNLKKLKSHMFVNVNLPVALEEGIIIPRESVMDTGMRKIIFVQRDEGTFEPREIQTGMQTDDGFEIKSGLKEGDRIVVSGNFLLDSESRVQAGLEQGGSHG
jgi:multidrug efflux pump subunit AcrA (membrane-fusion protein)